ncbi:arsenical-resistance protein [Thiorhodovibrio winogradskyi]|uniref:Arsenical-resistance protein n=1 Tax=Thiorhodovibrio winogradskyi TaxID=77007 RepID=A0ABZ0S6Z3_9GAMM
MSVQCETLARQEAGAAADNGMSLFERYLSLWVVLCILTGIGLGHVTADAFQAIGSLEVARINLPVAVLIWLMIIPMLLKVDLTALSGVTAHWRGSVVTLVVNWAIKPFSMAVLAWLFIGEWFRPYLPAGQIDSYIAGMIILGAGMLLSRWLGGGTNAPLSDSTDTGSSLAAALTESRPTLMEFGMDG